MSWSRRSYAKAQFATGPQQHRRLSSVENESSRSIEPNRLCDADRYVITTPLECLEPREENEDGGRVDRLLDHWFASIRIGDTVVCRVKSRHATGYSGRVCASHEGPPAHFFASHPPRVFLPDSHIPHSSRIAVLEPHQLFVAAIASMDPRRFELEVTLMPAARDLGPINPEAAPLYWRFTQMMVENAESVGSRLPSVCEQLAQASALRNPSAVSNLAAKLGFDPDEYVTGFDHGRDHGESNFSDFRYECVSQNPPLRKMIPLVTSNDLRSTQRRNHVDALVAKATDIIADDDGRLEPCAMADSIRHLDDAIDLESDTCPLAFLRRGQVYCKTGSFELGLSDLRKALRLQRECSGGADGGGDFEETRKYIYDALLLQAEKFFKNGAKETARETLREAKEIFPTKCDAVEKILSRISCEFLAANDEASAVVSIPRTSTTPATPSSVNETIKVNSDAAKAKQDDELLRRKQKQEERRKKREINEKVDEMESFLEMLKKNKKSS